MSESAFPDLNTSVLEKPAELLVFKDNMLPVSLKLERSVRFAYGREPSKNSSVISLNYSFLSDPEALICFQAGRWFYTSYGYDHGTKLNGSKIACQKAYELKNYDRILIEKNTWSVLLVFLDEYQEKTLYKKLLLNDKKNGVTLYSDASASQMQEDGVVTKEEKREAHQVHFSFEKNEWVVHDVNTIHGVILNHRKIKESSPIAVNDVLEIGSTMFVVRRHELIYSRSSAVENRLSIHIEEKAVWNFFRRKVLLKDIDLNIDPGNMVLLLGGSGAGKTTFINAVTGYEKARATIKSGNLDVYADYDRMKYEIGMVPQQDLLRGSDSVKSTLMNAAEMRMPQDVPVEDKEKRVKQVLALLGLEKQMNMQVDKLSGGQRKRLSIAVEYIADPSIFILDEPDSGLDGVMARELMELLRKIADRGKIVLVITHTPDRVIDLFDKVIVLAKSAKGTGEMAYYGTVENARKYFGVHTMEDIVRLVSTKEEGGEGRADEFIEKYKALHPNDKDENGQEDALDALLKEEKC